MIEMMVSMAIISIMATTLYGTYPSTNKFVSFATSVTDFASQLREIQTYGASRGGIVAKGDGIYLTTDNPYNYYLYQDQIDSSSTVSGIGTSNYFWDGPSVEATTTKTFLNNVMLSDICYGYEPYEEWPYDHPEVYDPGVEVMSFACYGGRKNIDIVFTRPKLDAHLISHDWTYFYNPKRGTQHSSVCLEFIQPGVSTSTQQRSIVIRSTGEIRVLQTRCPTTPLYN